jgi:glycosyltransferase involved in cell wall biosynthesis
MSTQSPQTKQFAVKMLERMKDRFYESRALQYMYRPWVDIQLNVALFRGQSYTAASRLLHVWRQLGREGFGAERMERLKELIQENCYRDGELLPAAENRLRLEFVRSEKAKQIRKEFASFSSDHRARLRFPNDNDPERQGDLIILKKYDPKSTERGVLLVKYSEAILAMPAMYDLGALASRYMLVLEPSQWGYQDSRFLLYVGSDLDVLVQSPRRPDFEFLESLNMNLVPVNVGSGDWGDPALFHPREAGQEAQYDVVMVAAWDPLKRHEVFFRAAAQIKQQRGQALRIALIGYNMRWTREPIERLLRQYDLERDCTIFEDIPHVEVAHILADSKVSLLLSLREGSNKSIYESMFCGTPVIVYRRQRGMNLEHVNSRTGLLADDDQLIDAIKYILDNVGEFDPRGWALENVGYPNSSKKIDVALKAMCQDRNRLWTRSIVAKKNGPHLRYTDLGQYEEFADEYESLRAYLLQAD